MRNDRQPIFLERLPVSAVICLGLWLLSASAPAQAAIVAAVPAPAIAAAVHHNLPPVEKAETPKDRVVKMTSALPMMFVPNQGQTDSKVKFSTRGSGASLAFTPGGVDYRFVRSSAPAGPAPCFMAQRPLLKLLGRDTFRNRAGCTSHG